MANGWWGDWRPSLPAHTGDLQATDLIECTSMTGGVPTNSVITGQQIIDAAAGGGGTINPVLLGFSGILGTNTTSTTITICHSLLIPANTLGTNNILQLMFRMYRVSGNVGQLYGRIYFNTTNSLTGATLFNTNFTMNGGGTQFTGYVERNFSYNGTNLTGYSNAAFSDYTTGNIVNVAFNKSVDNYVIFTMQCQNIADVANINLFKVFAYV
jgi:hypothetical protein